MRTMPKCFSSKSLSICAALLVIFIDQVSKFYILSKIDENYFAVTSFFNLVLVLNKGVTFGFLRDAASPFVLLLFASVVILFLLIFVRNRPSYYRLPAAVIIGGAIGNAIDRIIHGAVVDFLDFHLSDYHWPAFNIADMSVVVGVFALFYITCIEEEKKGE